MDRYRHDVMVDLAVSLGPRPTPAVLRHLLPDPDLLIILDIDEEIAWQRKPDSPSLAYLTERRRAYQRLAEAANVQPIDASQSPSDVGNEIFERVLQLVPIDR
jgi:thymidylate kinase